MITRLTLPRVRETDIAHIEKTLEAVARVQSVTINLGDETATIEHDGASLQELRAAARTVGFTMETHEDVSTSGSHPARFKIILTPVDFSSITDRVVQEAVTLARTLHGRVTLINVTEPTAGVVDYAAIVVAVAQVNEAVVKHSIARLGQIEQQLKEEGVEVASIHTTGTPVSEIIEQARELPADYIVIGSHGHTAFYDLLVGGTAHGILKRAPCPVVIVPAPAGSGKG